MAHWENLCYTEYGNGLPCCYSPRDEGRDGKRDETEGDRSMCSDITDKQRQRSQLARAEMEIRSLAYPVVPAVNGEKDAVIEGGREGGMGTAGGKRPVSLHRLMW